MLAAALCTALLAKAAHRELRAHAYARKKKKISEANAQLMSRASFAASSERKKKKQGERTTQSLGDDPVYYFCFATALLLLYYCFTTALLLLYSHYRSFSEHSHAHKRNAWETTPTFVRGVVRYA
jgi:hypothetical protein